MFFPIRTFITALSIVTSFALAAAPAGAGCYLSAKGPLQPPSVVLAAAGSLHQIDSLAGLPEAIRVGTFGGVRGGIAAPGADFNATDEPRPGLAPRRLVFAACDDALCIVHYEWGGVAAGYEVLALAKTSNGWKNVWHVSGGKPLANLAALQQLLANTSPLTYYAVADASCY